MYFTGFADEVSPDLDIQIKVTKELGWSNIETRKIGEGNLASISDAEFDQVCQKLDASGVSFNCYGSGIANWSQPITESPEKSYEEMKAAIPRMNQLGIKLVRIMSYAVPEEVREQDFSDEVIKRLGTLVKMAEDGGVTCVHENCNNWGGLSYEHTLKLLDRIQSPNFKLVFDTGNPVFSDDVRGAKPYKKQSALEFYNAVKDHIAYIHIKDCRMEGEKEMYSYPGEGEGDVIRIMKDVLARGYDGGISIEPHMVFVFHENASDANAAQDKLEYSYQNYLEYGRRAMSIIQRIKNGEPV